MKNTKRVLAFLVGAAMMLPMASAEGTLASGDYEATSQGFGGAVTVKVTVTDGKVTAATITGDKETEAIGGAAIKTLTEKLIGVSSADEVDAVASATVPSNAVKAALADCLRQAAGDLTGMPCAAERPVEVDPVRANVQRVNALLQQYGFMLKFHQIPISSISAASSSAETLASSSS